MTGKKENIVQEDLKTMLNLERVAQASDLLNELSADCKA